MESFDAVAVGMRGAAFVGALQATGLSLFIAAHRSALAGSMPSLMALARLLIPAGFVLVIGHQVVEASRLAGEWSGLVDIDIQRGNWHRSPGVSALVCGAGLALEYAGCRLQGALGRILMVLGALGVVVSFALTGHTTHSPVSPLIGCLLVLHVAIVGYWLGSVVALIRLARVGATESLYEASSVFSASAVWIVPAILPLGVGIACGLLPNLAALHTVYGALLATKVTGFAALLILAAVNRWRLVPALQQAPLLAKRRFRYMLHAEYLLLSAILTVTAVMTSLFSWH
jgi:putative copper resistance protein D